MRLGELQESITEKYVKNKSLNRTTEELLAQSIYRILEYFSFTKSDTHNIASKYMLKSGTLLEEVKSSYDPSSVNSAITLDPEFKTNL